MEEILANDKTKILNNKSKRAITHHDFRIIQGFLLLIFHSRQVF